jgi:hypothetical protein
LQFLIAVQKIMMETNEKTYKTSLENITKTYLHGKVPAGVPLFLLILPLVSWEEKFGK